MKRIIVSGVATVVGCYFILVSAFSMIQVMKEMKPYRDCCILTLYEPLIFNDGWKQKLEKEQSEQDEDNNEELQYTLFHEKMEETVVNEEFNRTVKVTAIAVAGSSGLLFPGEYALTLEETDGCLISEATAWKLFGDKEAVGNKVKYQNKTYQIQGILKENGNLFIFEAEKNQELNQVIAKAENGMREDEIADTLLNKYQLSGKVSRMYWPGLPKWGTSIKEIKDDFWYLISKENNVVEMKYFTMIAVIVKNIIELLTGCVVILIIVIRRDYSYNKLRNRIKKENTDR